MDIFILLKMGWTLLVSVVIFAIGYTKLQEQVNNNKSSLDVISTLLTSGEAGGAPFLTDKEHERKQSYCQRQIESRIRNIEEDMGDIRDVLKEGDECRKEARQETAEQLTAIRKEFSDHYTDLAILVTEIKTTLTLSRESK